jgi:hypothetical protein
MLRLVSALFLMLHGAIHLGYATPDPDDPRYPFSPDRAWIGAALRLDRATTRAFLVSVAGVTVAAYAVSAVGVLLGATWWQPFAIAGSIASLAALLLAFHPWLALGVAIDVAIIVSVASTHWPAGLFR